MRNLDYRLVHLQPGFWSERQRINRIVTLPHVYDQFAKTGRIGAFRCAWKPGEPFEPHVFWDSDVAKWIEAAAYMLAQKPDPGLETQIDQIVNWIAENQMDDGYFNTHFQTVEPQNRFSRRPDHELYCAGHLFEAACAYAEATGKRKFLDCMLRYADLIDRVFRIENSAAFATPGHEEIELALIRLWQVSGERRYLDLAIHFLDRRGTDPRDGDARVTQSHAPVRRQATAEGHAVRAMYLFSAMADAAAETGDTELREACLNLFDNIVNRRMYVTGGIGSTSHQEAFTIDYDLPDATAYAESCAAIGLMLFSRRLQLLAEDAVFADIVERVMYNGFLSSVSLDGRSFFYENPLAIRPELADQHTISPHNPEPMAAMKRAEIFSCSCCPPNILRTIASIGNYLYTLDDATATLYVQQYMASCLEFEIAGQPASLIQETDYPYSGRVSLIYRGPAMTLAVRVPGWSAKDLKARYERYSVVDGSRIELDFTFETRLLSAHPRVRSATGRCAVQRGPLVYCLESIDNGSSLDDRRLVVAGWSEAGWMDSLGVLTIKAEALRRDADRVDGESDPPLYADCRLDHWSSDSLTLIPYFAFANRGIAEMQVWTLTDRACTADQP